MKHLKVECSQQPLNATFHASRHSLLAAGLVDGTIEIHDFSCLAEARNDDNDEEENDTIVSSTEAFSGSCRTVQFSRNTSELLVAGGSNGEISGWDANRLGQFSATATTTAKRWTIGSFAHDKRSSTAGIQVVKEYSDNCWASGDENGCIRLWDVRQLDATTSQQPKESCCGLFGKHDDYISSLVVHPQVGDNHTLLATSADGRLSVYDIRNPRAPHFTRISDDQEDELLSVQIMKSGTKVVCGTATGVLAVFSWGTWGDVSDRYPGHGASIDAMVAVNESTLVLGTGDGELRVVTVQPDRCLGVLSSTGGADGEVLDHGGLAIESLQFTHDRRYLASVTHDAYIRLMDASILEEDEEGNIGRQVDETGEEAEDSDDEPGDENKDDDTDTDEDDSDGDEDPRRRKRMRTEAEKFFDDL